MSLGPDFSRRWQQTAPAYRARVFAELQAVCARLAPDSQALLPDLGDWPEPYDRDALVTAQAGETGELANVGLDDDRAVAAALKSRFLREADDMIEVALQPVRRQLRQWLQQALQEVLAEARAHRAS